MDTIVTASGSISSMSALIGSETHRRLNSGKSDSDSPTKPLERPRGSFDTGDRIARWKYPTLNGDSSLNFSTSSNAQVSLSPSIGYGAACPPMSAEMKSWRNTSEAPTSAPLRPQTHRTSASMPYGNLASASNGPGRSGSGTPCTALNTVFSLLAYKGLIKACYNIAFTFCLVVFFAALSGIGYNPPSSAEGAALPISQQMEARKAPVLLKHGLIGAVHAASNDTTVNFLDITPPEPTEWSDARGGKQAFEQRQRERQFIQDSPADPHLDGEHAAHPHHVGEDNIFDKAKVVPEGHIEHEQQGSTVEVVHRRYAMREGEHNADAAADQVDVEQTEDGAGEEEEAPFVDVGEETSLEQQAMEVEAADDAFIEESAEAEDRVEQEQVEDDHKVALKLRKRMKPLH